MDFPRVVYALRLNSTGKYYVGSTEKIKERLKHHVDSVKRGDHPSKQLQKDFDRYGGGFTVFILDVIRDYDSRNKEYLWMDALRARETDFGYNAADRKMPSAIGKFEGVMLPTETGEEKRMAFSRIEELAKNAIDHT